MIIKIIIYCIIVELMNYKGEFQCAYQCNSENIIKIIEIGQIFFFQFFFKFYVFGIASKCFFNCNYVRL